MTAAFAPSDRATGPARRPASSIAWMATAPAHPERLTMRTRPVSAGLEAATTSGRDQERADGSSSVMVPTPVEMDRVAFTALRSRTTTSSAGSSTASPMTVTSIVRCRVPGAKVSVPAVTAV